jgi:hypothetical protein
MITAVFSVINTKCYPQHYLSFLVNVLEDYKLNMLQLSPLTKQFSIQIIHENISSIIHDNTCSLIQKKCHPKSYHNGINYHMTLNNIFSALNAT